MKNNQRAEGGRRSLHIVIAVFLGIALVVGIIAGVQAFRRNHARQALEELAEGTQVVHTDPPATEMAVVDMGDEAGKTAGSRYKG